MNTGSARFRPFRQRAPLLWGLRVSQSPVSAVPLVGQSARDLFPVLWLPSESRLLGTGQHPDTNHETQKSHVKTKPLRGAYGSPDVGFVSFKSGRYRDDALSVGGVSSFA